MNKVFNGETGYERFFFLERIRWIIRKEENVNAKISIRQNKNDELYLFYKFEVITCKTTPHEIKQLIS